MSRSKKHISNDFSIDTLSLFFSFLSLCYLSPRQIYNYQWMNSNAGTVILFICFVQNSNRSYSTHGGFCFSFFTCVFGRTNKNLKNNKACIYYQNHQSSIYYLKKYTQYVYIYTVNHIVLSLMINKSTTNRMQCYSLIRI